MRKKQSTPLQSGDQPQPQPMRRKPRPNRTKPSSEAAKNPALLDRSLTSNAGEPLLRALGVWDFARLPVDPLHHLRLDLLSDLVLHYDPSSHRSSVAGAPVSVSRLALASALRLPVERSDREEKDSDSAGVFAGEEAIGFVLDFMDKHVLLRGEAGLLPLEVAAATRLVKEGRAHLVDWAGVVSAMVERDLAEAPRSGACYYASHLQCLMKHQRPELFEEEPGRETVGEPEPPMLGFRDVGRENYGVKLSLGLSGGVDAMEGIGECKGKEEENRVSEGKDAGVEHCFRRCDLNEVPVLECEDLSGGGVGGKRVEEECDNGLEVQPSLLGWVNSIEVPQGMEIGYVSCRSSVHPVNLSSEESLSTDIRENITRDGGPCRSLLFGKNCGRQIIEIDDDANNYVHEFLVHDQRKKMRSGEPSEHSPPAFGTCMDQGESWMGKAKIMYMEREHALRNAQLNLQLFNEELERKDQTIRSLQKSTMEEKQKRQMEARRFEHELRVMTHLFYWYKNALKGTRSAFSEYRKQCPEGDKPLYKDDIRTGDVVLSTCVFERQRLNEEAEMVRLGKDMIQNTQKDWFAKFVTCAEWLSKLITRLVELDEEVRLLRKSLRTKES